MATVLVIGGNRGIGLALCKQLRDRGDDVIATCREDIGALATLGVQVIKRIDVSQPQSVETIRQALANKTIDLLIHGSGILTNESFEDLDFDRIRAQFEVNTLGPLRMVHGLTHHLKEGAKVGIISSRVGSLDDNGSGGMFGYRMSKSAVNMVGVNLSHELKPKGVALALLHPGLVATEMTGGQGISPAKSAQGLIQRMDQLNLGNTGKFWHAEGYELPW
ncbi:MAG: SDR family NAD(P)-dependent oxidoreductase [Gammaproteobacteria bacterium]|nr:SDR family NAD(P)-dependent oxidoreductase [Gammaproteobacteria bacterium]